MLARRRRAPDFGYEHWVESMVYTVYVLKDELEGFMNINNIHYSYPPIIYQFVLRYSYRDIRMMTVIGRNGLNLNQTKETLTLALVNYICQERQRRYLRREQFF